MADTYAGDFFEGLLGQINTNIEESRKRKAEQQAEALKGILSGQGTIDTNQMPTRDSAGEMLRTIFGGQPAPRIAVNPSGQPVINMGGIPIRHQTVLDQLGITTPASLQSLRDAGITRAGQVGLAPEHPDQMAQVSQALQVMEAAGLSPAGMRVGGMTFKSTSNANDKSYQFHSTQLDKLQAPLEGRLQRLSTLQDTLNQQTPQADALVAPELLTVMAGGQGSGLRMNEAEIARIVGGRTHLESLKAAMNKWQTNPAKGLSITPAQRAQVRTLIDVVQRKLSQKTVALDQARQQLIDAPDSASHRQILYQTHKALSDIDVGMDQAQSEKAQSLLSRYSK